VGYVGRDVESMVRDLVEQAVKLIRAEKKIAVQQKAKENAEEKIQEKKVELQKQEEILEKDENIIKKSEDPIGLVKELNEKDPVIKEIEIPSSNPVPIPANLETNVKLTKEDNKQMPMQIPDKVNAIAAN
jgi:ATP-dependent protease HslVU (ClpYQ) ATPase subunit